MTVLMFINKAKTLLRNGRAQKVVSAILSRGISTIASFALIFAASKLLTTQEYGFYLFMFTVASAVGMIASGSVPFVLMKHLRGPDAHDENLNNWLINKLSKLQLKWFLAVAFFCAALAFTNPPRLEDQPLIAIPLFIFIVVFALGENLLNYFRVKQEILWALFPRENIWRILSAITLSGMAILGISTSGFWVFSIVTGILAACILVQFFAFVKRQGLSWISKPAQPENLPDSDKNEVYFFSAHTFLNAMAMHFETLIIGIVIGLEAAAFYFVAKRLTQLLLLPTLAIDTLGVPMITSNLQKNDTQTAQKIISYCSLGSFGMCLIGALFMLIAGPFILGLFKPEFVEHFDVVIVLTLGALVNAWFGPGSNVLMVAEGEKFFFWMRSGTAIIAAICIIIFGYFFGMMGVALSSFILGTIEEIWVSKWTKKKLGLNLSALHFFLAKRATN